MLSPSGRLSHFSGRKRVEDVILRYINLSDRDTGGIIPNKEQIISTIMKIKTEKDLLLQSPATPGSDIEEIQKQIIELQHQLERDEEQLRIFEPDSEKFTSLEEFQACEMRLTEALRRVTQRKAILLTKVERSSSYQDSIQQINTVVQYITDAQVFGTDASLDNLEHDDHGINFVPMDHMNFGSDAASATFRERSSPSIFEVMSQTSGPEVALSGDGYQSNSIMDGVFQL